MTTDVRVEWGSRLRTLRKERQLSLREISERAGISKTYYCRLESGGPDPSTEVRLALARALEVQVGDVFVYPDTVRHGLQGQ